MLFRGPLSDATVLEIAAGIRGPYATALLADLGATIIKIETAEGDRLRRSDSIGSDLSSVFLNLNRGKKSVVLDHKSDKTLEILAKLVKNADAVMVDPIGSAFQGLDLSYSSLVSMRPDIIRCEVIDSEGVGSTDEDIEFVAQSASGIAYVQGYKNNHPEYVVTNISHKTVGIVSALSIVAALVGRNRMGAGRDIKIPVVGTMASYLLLEQLSGATFEPTVGSPLYSRTVSPYRRPFKTADGYIAILLYNDGDWTKFFSFAGMTELLGDPRFSNITLRTENIDVLYEKLGERIATNTTAHWLKGLSDLDIPCSPINDFRDLLEDPHLKDVSFFKRLLHPVAGPLIAAPLPAYFSANEGWNNAHSPSLGEYTEAVLIELDQKEPQRRAVGASSGEKPT
jgi:crotonobetainyl-CoA:carnitine CoA-transferase CaiB-like acyl-CoA transferase